MLVVLAGVAAVYGPTIDDYFHGDDFIAFQDLTTKNFFQYMGDGFAFNDSDLYWRPLGLLYYRTVFEAFGLSPVAYHLTNLAAFLGTLALIYVWCVKEGLGRAVGVGAVAIFGLYPNHPVSVAWITNAPRELSVFAFVGGMVLLQRALSTRRLRDEVLAWLVLLSVPLFDETSMVLLPVAVLYSAIHDWARPAFVRRLAARASLATATIAFLAPLQFVMGKDSVSRSQVELIGVTDGIFDHYWALASKLVLPLDPSSSLSGVNAEQWVAGAVVLALGAVMLAVGSVRMRLLVVWAGLGLAPFSLWTLPFVPGRYVYLAAVPFAIAVSWVTVEAYRWLVSTTLWRRRPAPRLLTEVGFALVLPALVFAATFAGSTTEARNDAYGKKTEPYRALANDLPKALPEVPKSGRIIIFYGIWNEIPVWPDSVVKTVYRDRSLKVLNVPARQVEASSPGIKATDRVVFYTDRGFIAPVLRTNAGSPVQPKPQ